MTTTPNRRRLSDHIGDALSGMAARILTAHPERADELADWLETAHERLVVAAYVDRNRKGRPDTRSLRFDVYLRTAPGLAPLCSVRARDLLDADGRPVDARADARTLLLQNGIGIPDDLSGLDNDTG